MNTSITNTRPREQTASLTGNKVIRNTAARDSMQIIIQSRGFSLTDALLSYAQRRLLFAMSYCSGHVNRVAIRLSNNNDLRGGTIKRCHIQVVLVGIPDVVVEDIEVDLYAAIDRAIDRAGRIVVRQVDRQFTRTASLLSR